MKILTPSDIAAPRTPLAIAVDRVNESLRIGIMSVFLPHDLSEMDCARLCEECSNSGWSHALEGAPGEWVLKFTGAF